MKIKSINLQNFKYFDDFKIEFETVPDLVLLVGENGTGKSCIFDAFHYFIKPAKTGGQDQDFEYLKKDKTKSFQVEIKDEEGALFNQSYQKENKVKFYGRSAYRFTREISRRQIGVDAARIVNRDADSPERFIDLDSRLENDVEKALGELIMHVQDREVDLKSSEIRKLIIDPVNESLKNVLGEEKLIFDRIIDPYSSNSAKIDLYFKKKHVEFNYRNLSAGEKEIFDILFNFYRRVEDWIAEGIYYIDEPELHINTKVQANLLKELFRLTKKSNTQLWVATHSLGFIKAFRELEKDNNNLAILEFKPEYSIGSHIVSQSKLTREDWKRVLRTPLDELTDLLAPETIIYCEGRAETRNPRKEEGLDAQIYNKIFGETHSDVLFVSAGGNNELEQRREIALKVLQKAFLNTNIVLLKDLDSNSGNEVDHLFRDKYLKENTSHRMLERFEIENYLYDKEILKKYCKANNTTFNETEYDNLVRDICNDNVKDKFFLIKGSCTDENIGKNEFYFELAQYITADTNVFKELENSIF